MEGYCTRCGYAIEADFVCCPDCGLHVEEMASRTGSPVDGGASRASVAPGPAVERTGSRRGAAPTVVRRLDHTKDRTDGPTKGAPTNRKVARIEVMSGHEKGMSFDLRDSTTIGRGSRENGIALNDDSVSRRHAVIEYADGRYVYTDAGSMNGSFAIGATGRKKRIRAGVALQDGDQLELGSVRIAFRLARE